MPKKKPAPKVEMERVALFDGGWLLHRAAHAALRNRPNSWVEAAAGFVSSWVFSTAVHLRCSRLAFLSDSDTSFRRKLYPEYKSNRGGTAEESLDSSDVPEVGSVYEAKETILNALQALNVPCWEIPGYEADDLFAAYVKHMPETYHAFLITKDKDMVQLVNERVTCYVPALGKQGEVYTTPENVSAQRMGFTAAQFLDYQTLIGDKIDCVPAILTPAKAKKILQEHRTLRRYFQTKEGLAFWNEHQDRLVLNRKLVKLHDDAFENFPSTQIKQIASANVKQPPAYKEFASFAFSTARRLF